MIIAKQIQELVQEALGETDIFIVDVSVDTANRISVEIDKREGISIDDCIKVSRFVERSLDREQEDFELSVSSPGIGKPLKVWQQYLKLEGQEAEIALVDGSLLKGTVNIPEEGLVKLSYQKKQKKEGQKKPEIVQVEELIPLDKIAKTRQIIKFGKTE